MLKTNVSVQFEKYIWTNSNFFQTYLNCYYQVYQRGVINPMTNIEQFWKDYIAFEQNINPIIAEKMGMERSRDYMNARRVAKEFEAATRGVNRNAPSVPPTVATEEVKQVC